MSQQNMLAKQIFRQPEKEKYSITDPALSLKTNESLDGC